MKAVLSVSGVSSANIRQEYSEIIVDIKCQWIFSNAPLIVARSKSAISSVSPNRLCEGRRTVDCVSLHKVYKQRKLHICAIKIWANKFINFHKQIPNQIPSLLDFSVHTVYFGSALCSLKRSGRVWVALPDTERNDQTELASDLFEFHYELHYELHPERSMDVSLVTSSLILIDSYRR